jgi:predicted peptidase
MIRETLSINGLNYLKYSPEYIGVDYPAIVFLHGRGERGTNLSMLEVHSIPYHLKNGLEVPYVVYCPQIGVEANSWYRGVYDKLKTVLDTHSERHVTGLSMGGSGAFSFAGFEPKYFKTAGVVCGKPGTDYKLYRGIRMKCWHGDLDGTVPYTSTVLTCAKLQEEGEDCELKLYLGDDHDIWHKAYYYYAVDGYWTWLMNLYPQDSAISLDPGQSITVNGLKISV